MTQHFAQLDGRRASKVRVYVGNVGPWYADVDLDDDAPAPLGKTSLVIGSLELVGTVVPVFDGTFGEQRKCRVVAGAGGWSAAVPALGYHNDAGVKSRLIADDLARLVGETIGDWIPAAERVGIDYARQAGVASRSLEDAAGLGVAWHVDYAGLTHAGPRVAEPVDAAEYHLLAYDPRTRIATLAVEDPGAVRIGSILPAGLDMPRACRQLELGVDADELRVSAWVGGSADEPDRLGGLLRAIVARVTDGRLHGCYRYRVVRQVAERVELQAVRQAAGLPDLGPVSLWPGLAGLATRLTPGAEVLVSFVEGDRTQPVVTAFAGPGATGFVPIGLVLGGDAGPPAARQGDAVEVILPPAVFSGTIGVPPAAQPITGVIQWPATKALGVITAGSSKVGIAS